MIEGLDIELPADIPKSVDYKYSIQKAEGYQSGNSPHSKYSIRTKTDEGFALSKDSDQKGPRGLIKGRVML